MAEANLTIDRAIIFNYYKLTGLASKLISIEKLLATRGIFFFISFNLHLLRSFLSNPNRCFKILEDTTLLNKFRYAVLHEPLDRIIENSTILQKRIDYTRTNGIEEGQFLYTLDDKLINDQSEITIRGWAMSNHDSLRVELIINNHLCATEPIELARPDVTFAFQDKVFNKNTGFIIKHSLHPSTTSSNPSIKLRIVDKLNFYLDIHISRSEFISTKELDNKEDNNKALYKYYLRKELCDILSLRNSYNQSFFEYTPLISIIIPTYNIDRKWLELTIESVTSQIYTNWEICIYDDCSKNPSTINYLNELEKLNNPKISIRYGQSNKGISEASNNAINLATGEYVALLDHDDVLSPLALYEVVKCLNIKKYDFIYSDEDKIDEHNERHSPHFKSDFNLFLLRCQNYICHLSVIKKKTGDSAGWFRTGYEGAQDHDLFLRIADITSSIHHIDKILYHWRTLPTSTSINPQAKKNVTSSAIKSLNSHLARNRINGQIKPTQWFGAYNIQYIPEGNPSVSIIIPFKDQKEILVQCISSILNKTEYSNYEILLISNNSTDKELFRYLKRITKQHKHIRYIEYNIQFNFSAIINHAANLISSDLILLLNNDTEVLSKGWLRQMVGIGVQSNVAAVGAKLLYPDTTIQHAGVITGIGGVAGHSHKFMNNKEPGYFLRAHLDQNLSACTGACLLLKTSKFREVGGMDENNLKVAFNDVDLCLRLLAKGYSIVYSSQSVLYHYESKSRGSDFTEENYERFMNEVNFIKRGNPHLSNDKFYNRNLTLEKENFRLLNN